LNQPASYPSGTTQVQTRPLVTSITACLAFIVLGTLLGGAPPDHWNGELRTPAFGPPAVLFLLMAALYYVIFAFILYRAQVYVSPGRARRWALGLSLGVMAMNELWNVVFLELRSPTAGFVGMALFFALLVWLWVLLFGEERFSFWILSPYAAWAAFDLLWSYQIWRLNP